MPTFLLLFTLMLVSAFLPGCGNGFCNFVGCGSSGEGGSGGGGGGGGGGSSPNFAAGTGFDGPPNVVAVASDGTGDIYVGGAFNSFNGSAASGIVRLNDDGTIDTNFANFGMNGSVNGIALHSNGDLIYVVGSFTTYAGVALNRIMRISTNGSLDLAFGIGPGLDGDGNDIAIMGDNRVVFTGAFTSYNSVVAGRTARALTNGAFDPTFSIGIGHNAAGTAIALQPDDKIYNAGLFVLFQANDFERSIRIHTNGSFDATFAVNGAAAGFNAATWDIAIAQDGSGNVFIGGEFTAFGPDAPIRLARLGSDGVIDTDNFGSVVIGANDTVNAILPVGSNIYIGGAFTSYANAINPRIARLSSDGNVDVAFSNEGFNGPVTAMAERGNSDIYVVGSFSSYGTESAPGIIRLNSDGSSD